MLDLKPAIAAIVLLAAIAAAPPALGKRAAVPPPSSAGLLELTHYRHALVQLERGSLAGTGATLISPSLRIWRVDAPTALRLLPGLLARGAVRAVEPDLPLRFDALQADPLSSTETWRPLIGADRVTPPGPGRPLTIVDTGLETSHSEFAGRPNTTILNTQRLTESDVEYHGTAVASLAAAPENARGIIGVYPQARLRIWDGGSPTLARVISGIEAAAAPGVVNLSLGFLRADVAVPFLADAVFSAFKRGVLVVAAAGNDRASGNPPSVPADLSHVITVGSTDAAGNVSRFSTQSDGVDLVAPGEDLVAAVFGGWAPVTGTSFSSPLVAAAAAWVWTARPRLDKTQLFELLRRSARDIGVPGVDNDSGYGLLDIPAALTRPELAVDPQEPNDDVRYLKAGGISRTATPPRS